VGGHKSISARGSDGPPQPLPPVPDYNVTGNPSPDCKCNYFEDGQHEGQPTYKRQDGLWYIWWDGFNVSRIISTDVGDLLGVYWSKLFFEPTGTYAPQNGAAGNAIVAAGGH
jgi:hypothetical protein